MGGINNRNCTANTRKVCRGNTFAAQRGAVRTLVAFVIFGILQTTPVRAQSLYPEGQTPTFALTVTDLQEENAVLRGIVADCLNTGDDLRIVHNECERNLVKCKNESKGKFPWVQVLLGVVSLAGGIYFGVDQMN